MNTEINYSSIRKGWNITAYEDRHGSSLYSKTAINWETNGRKEEAFEPEQVSNVIHG
jgi:hypothetical protein